ncbi:hypothetical protein [Corynebacterium terpenotabidum]|nr:hypothetical protein [Corynebacterium terpenotabidum]
MIQATADLIADLLTEGGRFLQNMLIVGIKTVRGITGSASE